MHMDMVVYNKINKRINMGCNFRLLAYILKNLIYNNVLSKYIPHRDTTSMHIESQDLKNYKNVLSSTCHTELSLLWRECLKFKKNSLMSRAHSSAPSPLIYKPPHSSPVKKLNKLDGNQPFHSSFNQTVVFCSQSNNKSPPPQTQNLSQILTWSIMWIHCSAY